MGFDSIIGQAAALKIVRGALASERLPHAYLFHGPEGVGKERAARGLAKALVCEKRGEAGDGGDYCDSCPACAQIDAGTHPDLTAILPETELVRRGLATRADFDGKPSAEIKRPQVRRLQEALDRRPWASPVVIGLIVEAHALNEVSQNTLLHALEEPRPGRLIVLVTSSPSGLIATIRSRCQKIRFAPLAPGDIVQLLTHPPAGPDGKPAWSRWTEERARKAAPLSRGSLSRALKLDTRTITARNDLIRRVEGLSPDRPDEALTLAGDLSKDRPSLIEKLWVLREWYRDVAAVVGGAGSDLVLHPDLAGDLERARGAWTAPGASRALARLAQTHAALEGQANATLAMETLFLDLARMKAA